MRDTINSTRPYGFFLKPCLSFGITQGCNLLPLSLSLSLSLARARARALSLSLIITYDCMKIIMVACHFCCIVT